MSNPLEPVLYPAQGTQGPTLYLNPYTREYTPSRSYALRMQRGFAAGLPQAVARRSGPSSERPFVSESEQRRLNFLARWGFEERVWRRLYTKYIKQINEMASPGAQIDKSIVRQVLANTPTTGLGADWLEQRLSEKLYDMQEYRYLKEAGEIKGHGRNPGTGGYIHFFDEANEAAIGMTPIQLWWYH